jgi:hypothetical protein
MKEPSSGLVLAACGAVVALALWSTLEFYGATEDMAGPNADVYKIGEQPARYEGIATALPATGIFGYVSDVSIRQTLGAVLYSGAQYALAPRLIVEFHEQPHSEWVIGSFSKPLDMIQFGSKRGLTLVKDFGSGVVLYRNGKP